MTAEQSITTLREVKSRMERLISYYQSLGPQEQAFVGVLELRLHSVRAAIRRQARG